MITEPHFNSFLTFLSLSLAFLDNLFLLFESLENFYIRQIKNKTKKIKSKAKKVEPKSCNIFSTIGNYFSIKLLIGVYYVS